MFSFDIVCCMDENRGIGIKGKIPWVLPNEMKYFKDLTIKTKSFDKNIVIMGRKTGYSIPKEYRPLRNRHNIVLSRDADRCRYDNECSFYNDCSFSVSFVKSLSFSENMKHFYGVQKVFVIGGAEVYKEAIKHPACKTLHLTIIEKSCKCDTFFPEFKDSFKFVRKSIEKEENGIVYRHYKYQRRKKWTT